MYPQEPLLESERLVLCRLLLNEPEPLVLCRLLLEIERLVLYLLPLKSGPRALCRLLREGVSRRALF